MHLCKAPCPSIAVAPVIIALISMSADIKLKIKKSVKNLHHTVYQEKIIFQIPGYKSSHPFLHLSLAGAPIFPY